MDAMVNARGIAHQILSDVFFRGAFSNLALNQRLSDNVPVREQRFIRQLVYGVLERNLYLEYVIEKLSSVPLKKLDSEVLVLLKLGIFQIKFLDRVPNSATVNETVQHVKKIKNKHVAGFVNAVLRNYIRNITAFDDMSSLEKRHEWSVRYSCPIWILNYWLKTFSKREVLDILESRYTVSTSLSIRRNRLKSDKDDFFAMLKKNDIQVSDSDILEDYAFLKYDGILTKHKLYRNGFFSIQDVSSGVAVEATDAKEGQLILDLCGAPGGKTCALSEKMKNTGQIISCDIHEHRLQLISESARRLGLQNITIMMHDALEKKEDFIEKFDTVLLDAPCSGLGTFRSKPEIFYHQSMEDILHLSEIQKRMLQHAASYVKSGGRLVYSTCTISSLENQQNVDNFLKNNPDFELDPFLNYSEGVAQIFPDERFHQGFFVAKFRKKVDIQ